MVAEAKERSWGMIYLHGLDWAANWILNRGKGIIIVNNNNSIKLTMLTTVTSTTTTQLPRDGEDHIIQWS